MNNRIFITKNGYAFFETDKGTFVDSLECDVNMEFKNLEDLLENVDARQVSLGEYLTWSFTL